MSRLDEIADLEPGWHDGAGKALDKARLDSVSKALVDHYPENLPFPVIYPTPEGNLLLEWESSGHPSLDIDLGTMKGDFHAFDAGHKDIEKQFLLDRPTGWKELFNFLSERLDASPV